MHKFVVLAITLRSTFSISSSKVQLSLGANSQAQQQAPQDDAIWGNSGGKLPGAQDQAAKAQADAQARAQAAANEEQIRQQRAYEAQEAERKKQGEIAGTNYAEAWIKQQERRAEEEREWGDWSQRRKQLEGMGKTDSDHHSAQQASRGTAQTKPVFDYNPYTGGAGLPFQSPGKANDPNEPEQIPPYYEASYYTGGKAEKNAKRAAKKVAKDGAKEWYENVASWPFNNLLPR